MRLRQKRVTTMWMAALFVALGLAAAREDIWMDVRCDEVINPDHCNFTSLSSVSLDELERCAPARLELSARNYFLAGSGRRTTYKDNKDAFDRIRIEPKMLRGVSGLNLETSVLGRKVDFPVGLSPTALHKLAHPDGEVATAEGVSGLRTVMILSVMSTTLLEEVSARRGAAQLWLQTYIFRNRSLTAELVQRAERSGFAAVVLTCDLPLCAALTCDARNSVRYPEGVKVENVDVDTQVIEDTASFEDIRWLKTVTNLPIVAKGILSGDDARQAVSAGASAVLVSNHGGRQIDGVSATIDALPRVVRGLRGIHPPPEVYMDGGVRSGQDVFKALARGAKMVFVGRPQIWGLTLGGASGVRTVLENLRHELNLTMKLGGVSDVSDINSSFLLPTEETPYPPVRLVGKTTREVGDDTYEESHCSPVSYDRPHLEEGCMPSNENLD